VSRSRVHVWRRRALLFAIVATVLVAGYILWFRDSSLVAVDEVEVEGATTSQEEIQGALEQASEGMSTLNVDEQALARSVSGFPTVASITVDATPPGKLTVTVRERLPVAQINVDGERVAVAGDGTLLPGFEVEGEGLPPLDEDAAARDDGVLNDVGTAQAAVLGGAPDELRDRIEGAEWDPERGGVVITVEGTPEIRFGDGTDVENKWKSAVIVLSKAEGAPAYVDVSVPGRPVSGG
jgi:cell division protein FtsQ